MSRASRATAELDRLGELEPVHARHLHVEQRRVERLPSCAAACSAQRLDAGAGARALDAATLAT